MAKSKESKTARREGRHDAPGKSGERGGIPWLLILCIILIIVTVALIVNELA
ncbi:MAG: hypothetical protein ABIF82_09705 [Planctomycetota bacterium]